MSGRASQLIEGLQEAIAHARGEAPEGVHEAVIVPREVDVKAIREHLALSQAQFAMRYGFSVSSVRNWEQRRRRPEGAARLLLKLIERKPETVEAILREEAKETAVKQKAS